MDGKKGVKENVKGKIGGKKRCVNIGVRSERVLKVGWKKR